MYAFGKVSTTIRVFQTTSLRAPDLESCVRGEAPWSVRRLESVEAGATVAINVRVRDLNLAAAGRHSSSRAARTPHLPRVRSRLPVPSNHRGSLKQPVLCVCWHVAVPALCHRPAVPQPSAAISAFACCRSPSLAPATSMGNHQPLSLARRGLRPAKLPIAVWPGIVAGHRLGVREGNSTQSRS